MVSFLFLSHFHFFVFLNCILLSFDRHSSSIRVLHSVNKIIRRITIHPPLGSVKSFEGSSSIWFILLIFICDFHSAIFSCFILHFVWILHFHSIFSRFFIFNFTFSFDYFVFLGFILLFLVFIWVIFLYLIFRVFHLV